MDDDVQCPADCMCNGMTLTDDVGYDEYCCDRCFTGNLSGSRWHCSKHSLDICQACAAHGERAESIPSSSSRGSVCTLKSSSFNSSRNDEQSKPRKLPKEYRHCHVPKNLNLAEEFSKTSQNAAPWTTIMIRNIPNRYSQQDLIGELEEMGFAGTFDFLYLPMDKGTLRNVGYSFVNFSEHSWAEKCMESFQDHTFNLHQKSSNSKMARVSVAHMQGLEDNVRHYERSVVNSAKLKSRRPVVLSNGSLKYLSGGDPRLE